METGRPTRLTGKRAMEPDGTEQSLIVESFQGSGIAPRNRRFLGCQTWYQWSVAAWLGGSSTKGQNLVKHWHLPSCLCHPPIHPSIHPHQPNSTFIILSPNPRAVPPDLSEPLIPRCRADGPLCRSHERNGLTGTSGLYPDGDSPSIAAF